MLRRVAHRLGYVPREQLTATREKLHQVQQRLEQMRRKLDEATAMSKQGRIAARQLAKARHDDQRRHDALLRQLTDAQERRVNQTTRLAAFAQELGERQTEVGSLDSRISAAGDEIERARDVLLGIEVKLDILEGAANVLDRRLRVLHPPVGLPDPGPAPDSADSR